MDTQTPPNAPAPSMDNTMIMGILAYLGILVVVPLVANQKQDPFIKFHAKQGLVLLIGEVIAWFFIGVPVVGWIFVPLVQLVFLVFVIIGIMNVVNKQMKELPVIGHLASNFKF